jgi:hypothetical protein
MSDKLFSDETSVKFSDERVAKRADDGSARVSKVSQDRAITENRENTDSVRKAERYAMLRATDTLLPNPPEMPGFHLVWLTTENSRDTLDQRYRRGYSLVTRDELPGFCLNSQKDAPVTAHITVNEMILAKIPMDLWEQDMLYLHHDLPLESAQNLKDSVRIGQDGKGRNVAYSGGEFSSGVADGYNSLGKAAKPSLKGIR